ncbi:hypothetical protein Cgig2_025623 [Carnegiea gigantea]|uniref:Uncharacterized protein n=1 Tax=Carnegiea gigantea TaxID=171969 RepID=A0A9Q1Q812_9CARY|nr:hypothetical protein Cgig2_025623 [Carnegiea gigantea]
MEPQPIMGVHLVLPRNLSRPLHPHIPHPPPPPLPPPPAAAAHPTRPDPGPPLPRDGAHLLHHLRRNPPLRRRRDPRHTVVLAAEQDHPNPMAPLFSTGYSPIGPGLLLVIHLLHLAVPPPPPNPLQPPPPPQPPNPPPPQPLLTDLHMLLLGCNLISHVGVLTLHLIKGGCNGIGAWGFNSILNAAILMVFLNFYVKNYKNVNVASGSENPAKAKLKDL